MSSAPTSSAAAVLSDADLRRAVFELVPTVDLETTGLKKFIKLLAKSLNDNHDEQSGTTTSGDDLVEYLKSKSDYIKAVLTDAIESLETTNNGGDDDEDEQEEEDENDSDDNNDSGEDESDGPATKKPSRRSGGGGGGGGLAEPKPISDALAEFLGRERGAVMARKDIVKEMWAYIREHDLQNPSNKREILLDAPMKQVFGCDTFTMFTMNKYIGAHVHPFRPVDLTSNTTGGKSPAKSTPRKGKSTPRKRGRDSASASKRSSSGGSASKKPRKAGTQPPYRLSEELQDVVQVDVLPRPQVVSKLWEYIKANQLQNPNDKREILCDDKLKRIFQNKNKVTMFNMNQFLSHHLLEKVDKNEYAAAAAAEDDEDEDASDSD